MNFIKTNKLTTFLLFFSLLFLGISCSKESTEEEGRSDGICFEGDIVLLGNNTLSVDTRIGVIWSISEEGGAEFWGDIFFFGEATINRTDLTFEICIDTANIPAGFTIQNAYHSSKAEFYMNEGLIFAFEDQTTQEGTFNENLDNLDQVSSLYGDATGFVPQALFYKADGFSSAFWGEWFTKVEFGFSIVECDTSANLENTFDDYVPYNGRMKLYIGSEEEIEAELGSYLGCNWT